MKKIFGIVSLLAVIFGLFLFPVKAMPAGAVPRHDFGDFSGDSDSQQGLEAVDDPDRTIRWLTDEEDERN